MDLFRKNNTNEHTAWDLGCSCSQIGRKTKKSIKKIINRKARARIRSLTKKELEMIEENY